MNAYSYIEAIKNRMSDEDVRFYRDIFAPVEVATPDSDAWDHLCVMPDGEIRVYGVYNKKSVFDTMAQRCYLSSLDGGLSWKRHLVTNRFTLGKSTYIPYLNKYMDVQNCGYEGIYAFLGDTPDDENPMRILVDSVPCAEIRIVLPLRNRDRVIIVAAEKRPELHSTAMFAVLYYADGDLRNWKRLPLEAVPFYQPPAGKQGVRWQQNNRENTIAELSDGRLMMISRTALDYHYVSYSEDGGESWSKPMPTVFHSTGTMPFLYRLSDGKLIFCWCNTRPLPEREDADGIWEDVFTNRDANHVAISEDEGKTWIGYREMALNSLRNAADFRSVGGPEHSRDKSVHQFQVIELPYNKIMVHYGQNLLNRIIIFDRAWLYEKSRCEDFIHGLCNVSSQGYVQSVLGCYRGTRENPLAYVGHCAYNRVNSAMMLPDPSGDGHEVLQICRNDDPRLVSGIGGAVWNFPIAKQGSVKIKFRVEGQGIRVSLLDHWVNPCDDEIKQIANFSAVISAAVQDEKQLYSEMRFDFDCLQACVSAYVNGKFVSKVQLHGTYPNGLCYLHLQSAASETDLRGTLIAGMEFEGV